MTQKFKVGDQVQVISESRLLTKEILEIDEDGEMYRIGTSSDNRCIHIYNLAPAPALVVVPQYIADWISLKKENGDHLYIAMDKTWQCMTRKVGDWLGEKEGRYELFARA
ncbi:hypothetical protein EP56_08155, partial [Listeriaceae bacterium FSL A5-0209]